MQTSESLTARQIEANALLAGSATHALLYGGSRSGKTYLLMRAIIIRALKAPKSRHAVLRFRFNHLRASVIEDTFPKVMANVAPAIRVKVDRTAWFAEFPNGSQIWFGGLDDKERVEKVLGQEHSTIYLNECSQIAFASREIARTRLAQQVDQVVNGQRSPLPLRMYYDCNPPRKSHWSYRLFREHVDPESRRPLANPNAYAYLQMNPRDNTENLSAGYISELESLSTHRRRRFLDGEYGDLNPNALWSEDTLNRWRVTDGELPDMQRVVIPVDPSGASDEEDNSENDEIGIGACGLGVDGNGYLLEDLTLSAGPSVWGKVATSAYDRHAADRIIGEVNYGGGMVEFVVKAAKPGVPYQGVTATRGKVVRAEPIASLYDQGKIRHVGNFSALEEELLGFSTTGYIGEGSPNRADMAIWGFTALFPGITSQYGAKETDVPDMMQGYRRGARQQAKRYGWVA